jgi:hypothetical protein
MKAVRVASRNEKRDDDCLPDNSNKRRALGKLGRHEETSKSLALSSSIRYYIISNLS